MKYVLVTGASKGLTEATDATRSKTPSSSPATAICSPSARSATSSDQPALVRHHPLRRPDRVNLEKSAIVALGPLRCSICEKFFVRESNEIVHDISNGKTKNRDFGVVGAEPLHTKQEIRCQDKRDPYQQKDDCPSSAKSE